MQSCIVWNPSDRLLKHLDSFGIAVESSKCVGEVDGGGSKGRSSLQCFLVATNRLLQISPSARQCSQIDMGFGAITVDLLHRDVLRQYPTQL